MGGTTFDLPSDFLSGLPSGWSADNYNIGVGTPITIFTVSNIAGNGLFVSPEEVNLTFTYEGASAAYTNQSEASLTFSNIASLFNTKASIYNVSTYTGSFNVGSNPGLVPISFNSLCFTTNPCDRTASNGGPITNSNLSIGFDVVAPNVAYAFLDDSQSNAGTIDYNDMIVKIVATDRFLGTPLPASIVLFGGGLSLLGFAGMRKRRKNAPVTSLGALA